MGGGAGDCLGYGGWSVRGLVEGGDSFREESGFGLRQRTIKVVLLFGPVKSQCFTLDSWILRRIRPKKGGFVFELHSRIESR